MSVEKSRFENAKKAGNLSAGAVSPSRKMATGVALRRLDELAESPRSVLESLRQPLEDGVVSVARVGGHALFPARFQLVGTING